MALHYCSPPVSLKLSIHLNFGTNVGNGRAQELEGAADCLHGLPRADERPHERRERKVFFS